MYGHEIPSSSCTFHFSSNLCLFSTFQIFNIHIVSQPHCKLNMSLLCFNAPKTMLIAICIDRNDWLILIELYFWFFTLIKIHYTSSPFHIVKSQTQYDVTNPSDVITGNINRERISITIDNRLMCFPVFIILNR